MSAAMRISCSPEHDALDVLQAISNYRATLSDSRSSNILQNDDQWITDTSTNTPVLVPSNGYTFERTDWQVRFSCLLVRTLQRHSLLSRACGASCGGQPHSWHHRAPSSWHPSARSA